MKKNTRIFGLLAALALNGTAQATLFDRGNGMIYDDSRNITWLADANYAKTSGYITPEGRDVSTTDGQMTWNEATIWAADLTYGGYDNWRLASGLDFANREAGIGCVGFCTETEMGHLFYGELGGTQEVSILDSQDPDLAKFVNIQPWVYWLGMEYIPAPDDDFLGPDHMWSFGMHVGYQAISNKESVFYAWAVRPGNVPEPSTLMLLGLAMATLGTMRLRQ